MTVIRMSVATVTASLATEISLCSVIVYNHRLGRRKWRYNRSIKPAVDTQNYCTQWQELEPLSGHTKLLHTVARIGSAALEVVVPFKATKISHTG